MSTEQHRFEAERWVGQAEEDLEAARVLRDGGRYAQACFYSQQSAEKALKGMGWLQGEELWGHSLVLLCEKLEELGVAVEVEQEDLVAMDRLYIPTRYPNGLPDIIPQQAFLESDAKVAIARAERVLQSAKAVL